MRRSILWRRPHATLCPMGRTRTDEDNFVVGTKLRLNIMGSLSVAELCFRPERRENLTSKFRELAMRKGSANTSGVCCVPFSGGGASTALSPARSLPFLRHCYHVLGTNDRHRGRNQRASASSDPPTGRHYGSKGAPSAFRGPAFLSVFCLSLS